MFHRLSMSLAVLFGACVPHSENMIACARSPLKGRMGALKYLSRRQEVHVCLSHCFPVLCRNGSRSPAAAVLLCWRSSNRGQGLITSGILKVLSGGLLYVLMFSVRFDRQY